MKTSIGEDVYFDLVAYSYTKNINIISKALYVWFDNPKSVSNSTYKTINSITDPTFTFNAILRDMSATSLIPHDLEEYYFIKFCVWYLLYSAKNSRKSDLIKMRNRLFKWLRNYYPFFMDNKIISPFLPKGDTVFNRIAVWGYCLLYKFGLDVKLLGLISR